jgi:hypothetical protein
MIKDMVISSTDKEDVLMMKAFSKIKTGSILVGVLFIIGYIPRCYFIAKLWEYLRGQVDIIESSDLVKAMNAMLVSNLVSIVLPVIVHSIFASGALAMMPDASVDEHDKIGWLAHQEVLLAFVILNVITAVLAVFWRMNFKKYVAFREDIVIKSAPSVAPEAAAAPDVAPVPVDKFYE